MTQARTTHRSGTGAAHLGFAMFGARGPLLSPEGEGGGAGGAAGSEGGAGAAPKEGEGGAKPTDAKFTQAQLDEIVKDRLEKDRKAREKPPAPRTDDSGNESKLSLASLKAMLDESNARSAKAEFKSEALEAGYRKDAIDDAFALFSAQKPEDRTAWFQSKAAFFGSGAAQGSSAAGTNNAASNAQQGKPPAAAPNAPAPHEKFVDPGGAVDFYTMDPAKVDSLTGAQIREMHERNVRTIGQTTGAPPPPRISMPQPKR